MLKYVWKVKKRRINDEITEGNYIIYYLGTLDDIFEGDYVQIYLLPLDIVTFENMANEYTEAVVGFFVS